MTFKKPAGTTMPTTRRGLAGLAAGLLPLPALAQRNTTRLVVPYTPAGLTDVLGRALAQGLTQQLGQTVVVENRPGANTIIGTQAVAQATADGTTMLMASGASIVLNPLLYKQLPYDAERDLAVLGVICETPLVMVVNDALPVRSVAEFIAYARQREGAMNYASVGMGNPIHLAAELFSIGTGLRMTNVVFAGSAPALLSLAAGDVQVMFDVISTSLPLIRDGRLRALAVTTRERLEILPEVPTVAESGVPGYVATTWFGLAVPKQTPAPAAERLRAALAAVQSEAGFVRRFGELGLLMQPPRDAAGVARYLGEERTRWGGVIQARGISLGSAP